MNQPYACGQCRGERQVECACCGHLVDCDRCNGYGIDPAKVNLRAFREAETACWKEFGGASWPLIETDEVVGRVGGETDHPKWLLRYADFPRFKPAPTGGGR